MKVLELFSGIGGMHLALKESGIDGQVTAAADINPIANLVYKCNFPATKFLQMNLESLSATDINSLEVNMIVMSPPCQPFTRVGLKKDVLDNRSCPLINIINILPHLNDNFKYILVENVKGFETSNARELLTEALKKCDFHFQEFILSPHQFYIPNSRHRYYLIGKKKNLKFSFNLQNSVMFEFPFSLSNSNLSGPLHEDIMHKNFKYRRLSSDVKQGTAFCIKWILEDENSKLKLSDEVLKKYIWAADVVGPESVSSCCFTKAYGHYIKGTGSLFCCNLDNATNVFEQLKESSSNEVKSQEEINKLCNLNLRYFSPKEISRLMCFPEDFCFPESLSRNQCYRLLGNSVNVHVISLLIVLLVNEKR